MEEKIVEILRSKFNLYHSECILDMIFNDEMDIYSFRSEVSKIIEAEKNDIDECQLLHHKGWSLCKG